MVKRNLWKPTISFALTKYKAKSIFLSILSHNVANTAYYKIHLFIYLFKTLCAYKHYSINRHRKYRLKHEQNRGQFALSWECSFNTKRYGNKGYNKKLTVQDFRGISISPVLSKVFEHCILRLFNGFLTTSYNQFGFKKSLSCLQAINCVRNIVNHYVSNGSTLVL